MFRNYLDLTPDEIFTLFNNDPRHELRHNRDFWLALFGIHLPFFSDDAAKFPDGTDFYHEFEQRYHEIHANISPIMRSLFTLLRMKKIEEFVALLKDSEDLAAANIDLNARLHNQAGSTLLSLAANLGLTKAVEVLLSYAPESVNTQGYQGFNVLDMAVASGNIETVKLLLSKGANIQVNGQKTTFTVAMRMHEQMFNVVLNAIDVKNEEHQCILRLALLEATTSSKDGYIRKLLLKGATFTRPSRIPNRDFAFYQNLYLPIVKHKDISYRQHALLLRELLNLIGIFEQPEQEELRGLNYYPRNENNKVIYQLIEYLIKEGPTFILPELRAPHVEYDEDLENFYYSTLIGLPEINFYSLLLDRADFDINCLLKDFNFDKTQLMQAVDARELAAIQLMLSKRKDLNIHAINSLGQTALSRVFNSYLMHEFLDGDEASLKMIIRTLLEYGAGLYGDLDIPNRDGVQAQLIDRVKQRNINSLKMMLSWPDLNIHVQDNQGKSALSYASTRQLDEDEQSRLQVFEALLEYDKSYQAKILALLASLKLDTVVVIGLKLNGKIVNRATPGFENAITTLEELFVAIKQDREINKLALINTCRRMLAMKHERSEDLEKMIRILKYTKPAQIRINESKPSSTDQLADSFVELNVDTELAKTPDVKSTEAFIAAPLKNICLNRVNHALLFQAVVKIPEDLIPSDLMKNMALQSKQNDVSFKHKRSSSVSSITTSTQNTRRMSF